MEKNILFLATVPSMITAFNTRNIKILGKMGYSIHAACNFEERSAWTDEQVAAMKQQLCDLNVTMHQIDVPRKPYHPVGLIKSFKQLRSLVKENQFCMMHNQSCVSGIVGRIALHHKIPIIMHTEHGFYYFKGGPLINWIFYPFDKLCSRWTKELLVINKDDYKLANQKLKANHVTYIPGVGIDINRFSNAVISKNSMRAEFGIPENAFVILSVGELNKNKNHKVIIHAIANIQDENIYYVICGEGLERERLLEIAKERGIADHLILTGNRSDVQSFYKMADIFAFPSKREGLGLASLEAMAAGLPLITSNRNGINDYATNGLTGFMYEPDDVDGFASGIVRLRNSEVLREKFSKYNMVKAMEFGDKAVDTIMRRVYESVLKDI